MAIAAKDLLTSTSYFRHRGANFISCASVAYLQLSSTSHHVSSQAHVYYETRVAALRILVWYKSCKLKILLMKTAMIFAENPLILSIMITLNAWYLRNQGLRNILFASEMTLEIRKVVIDVVEGALGIAVTADFARMASINSYSKRLDNSSKSFADHGMEEKSFSGTSAKPSILRRFFNMFRRAETSDREIDMRPYDRRVSSRMKSFVQYAYPHKSAMLGKDLLNDTA